MSIARKNAWMFAGVILLALVPLFLHHGSEDEEIFGGADGQAGEIALALNPDYEPIAEPFWEPPSGEIESLLFALQAALGAGLIGFYFGRRSAESRRDDASRGASGSGTRSSTLN